MINITIEQGENRRKTVAKAIEGLGDDFIENCRQAERIFIKVNLIDDQKYIACTHIDAVRGVLDVIREKANTLIAIGDAGYRGTKTAFSNFGYDNLLDEYSNITLVDLNDDNFVDGFIVKNNGTQNQIRRSKLAVESDFKISLTPMKTDDKVGVSLSVQNWVMGTWVVPPRVSATGTVWAHWPWFDNEGDEAHQQSIAELYKQQKCDVGIVDGIIAMEGDGPVGGEMVRMGVVLAGTDAVSVDAVASTLMGIDPSEIRYLQICNDMRLGVSDMTRINVSPIQMAELTREFKKPINFNL